MPGVGLLPLLLILVILATTSACGSPASPSTPDVQGLWHGAWVETTCAVTGQLPALTCGGELPGGELFVRLTQSGASVQGFLSVCDSEADNVNGMVASDGTVTLSGRGSVPFYDPITIDTWRSTVTGTAMTGTFGCTLYPGGSTSNTVLLTGTLKNVSLVSRDPGAVF
jgi:hypothetical protein